MKKSLIFLLSFLTMTSSLSAMEEYLGTDLNKTNIPHKPTLEEQLSVKRLVTNEDHTNFLKNALDTAQQDVMISSYSISAKRLFEEGIVDSIKRASKRGVNIYIYYNKSSQKEYEQLSKISKYCVKFEEIDNHSKCVIVDRTIHGKRTVAIGSYNWLSEAFESSSNASMVLSGMFVQGLGADIWDAVKFYQSLKHENQKGVNKFLGNLGAFTTGEYRFEEGEFYYTLSTPEAHGTLFDEVVEKAKERVLLFSPFIKFEKLKSAFTKELLEKFQKKGVALKLITLSDPCYQQSEKISIFNYLDNLCKTFPQFSYLKQPNFHAKTLLADDDFICEGSKNCLSSVDDLSHEANNFEMSVAVRGKNAKKLIEEFEKTPIGKSVLSKELIKTEPKIEEKATNFPTIKTQTSKSFLEKNNFEPLPKKNDFKIFTYRNKFYVRLNPQECLVNDKNEIIYFSTKKEAQQAASKGASPFFQEPIKVKNKEIEKKRKPPSIKAYSSPKIRKQHSKTFSKKNNFQIFSGSKVGKNGFCVRFDNKEYLVDDKNQIVYFSTKKEAQQAAYEYK